VARIEVTDPSWVGEYVAQVTPMVERHGGRYLARTPRVQAFEGEPAAGSTFLIISWPSKEAAEAFYSSAEYRPYRERRRVGAANEFILIAGEDSAQTAKISPC